MLTVCDAHMNVSPMAPPQALRCSWKSRHTRPNVTRFAAAASRVLPGQLCADDITAIFVFEFSQGTGNGT
jgi:hypothetical protein